MEYPNEPLIYLIINILVNGLRILYVSSYFRSVIVIMTTTMLDVGHVSTQVLSTL